MLRSIVLSTLVGAAMLLASTTPTLGGDRMPLRATATGFFQVESANVTAEGLVVTFKSYDAGVSSLIGRNRTSSVSSVNLTTGENSLPVVTVIAQNGRDGYRSEFYREEPVGPAEVIFYARIVEGFGRLKGATGEYTVRLKADKSGEELAAAFLNPEGSQQLRSHYVSTVEGWISTVGSNRR